MPPHPTHNPRDLDLHFASIPPDAARPGDGVRYLMEHARFLVDLPERPNFRARVRQLLRHGHVGEALFIAMAYDEQTERLRQATDGRATGSPRAPTGPPVPDAGALGSTGGSFSPRTWGEDSAEG